MSISHCYCSDYMTKPTQFGDEPVLCPVVIDILIVLMFTLTTGSSYAAGAYSVPFLLGSVGYLIMVLIEMKVK